MWLLDKNNLATPFLKQISGLTPTHDSPTQSLQEVWIQNASLEIVRLRTILDQKSISGERILGFEMPRFEGYDINEQSDFDYLEFLLKKYPELLEID